MVRCIAVWFWISFFNLAEAQVISHYDASNSPLRTSSIQALEIGPSNGLMVGSQDGLFQLDQGFWTEILLDSGYNDIRSIYCEQDTCWIGTTNGLVELGLMDTVYFNPTNSGLTDPFVRDVIKFDTALFIATSGGLFALRDGHFTQIGPSPEIPASNFTCFARSQSQLAVGTLNGGWYLLDSITQKFTISNSSLPDNSILGMSWMGSFPLLATPSEGAVEFMPPSSFFPYNTSNSGIATNASTSVLRIDPNLFLVGHLSPAGLSIQNNGNWHHYSLATQNLPLNQVNVMVKEGLGRVWLGGPQGLVNFSIGALGLELPEKEINVQQGVGWVKLESYSALHVRLINVMGQVLAQKKGRSLLFENLPSGVILIQCIESSGSFTSHLTVIP